MVYYLLHLLSALMAFWVASCMYSSDLSGDNNCGGKVEIVEMMSAVFYL
jgi:hypothetical protein